MEINRLFEFLEQIYQRADVASAFGEPETVGEKTLIPVARVWYGMGLGFGEGQEPAPEEDESEPGASGAGGAGGGKTVPIAVVEVSNEETKVISITDSTKVAVAGILMVAWNLFWITKTIRAFRPRKPRE
jgi:uncharacterized spore protein YtfJ